MSIRMMESLERIRAAKAQAAQEMKDFEAGKTKNKPWLSSKPN